MAADEGSRWRLHAFLLFLVLLFVWLSGITDLWDFQHSCWRCDGAGAYPVHVPPDPEAEGSEEGEERAVLQRCSFCGGLGRVPLESSDIDYQLYRLSKAVWVVVCVAIVGGLLWGLKAVDCRLCGGSGRLALQALPPEGREILVDMICVACEGRGRLGQLDRWVLRREDP